MKERCGQCKDYWQGSCKFWKVFKINMVNMDIDPNLTPLHNLRGQDRIIYWIARTIFWKVNKNGCFKPREISRLNYY